jgi:hypothetical protein
MDVELCRRTGKAMHPTYDAARAEVRKYVAINRERKNRAESRGLNIYRCRHCQSFHVGHEHEKPRRRVEAPAVDDC